VDRTEKLRRLARASRRPGAVLGASAPTLLAALCVLAASALPGAARAQQSTPTAAPDRLISIDSRLGVDDAQSQSPSYVGSLYWGIVQANTAVAPSNVDSVGLVIAPSLANLSIVLTDPLPVIDLSRATTPDPRVDLDGSDAPAFQLRTAEDVPADFVLLHVRTGRADLVDLDIASGRLDAQGDRAPLTVIVDRDGTLGFRYPLALLVSLMAMMRSLGVKEFYNFNIPVKITQVHVLLGNDASLPGDFTVDQDARLEIRHTDTTQDIFFAGTVDGAGRLVKSGRGRVDLTLGSAIHTGGTEIAAGTLIVTPNSLTGDVEIASASELFIVQNGPTRFDGSIIGLGSVRKTGTTQLVLGGTNSFRGGLFIVMGDVRGSTTSVPGNVTLSAVTAPDPTARLILDQDFDGTHTGNVSGSGVLRKEGSGRVLRQGTTSVDLTQVQAGTLAGDVASLGSTIELAAGGATVEFAIANAQVFGGSLFGAGNMRKTGIGSLALATDALHSGETVVAEGTLRLDADLVNSSVVRVDPGARLANTAGRIGGDLDNRGNLAPGATTTTLQVGGNATLASGSVLETELDAAGNASLLAVAGTATVNAPRYALALRPGDYSIARTYTLVTAGGIAPGSTPGQAIDDLAFIDVVGGPAFVGSSVQLSLQEDFTNLGSLGITPNQVSTAIALEQVTGSGSADARAIRDGLVPLRIDQVPAVLDTLAGETLSGFANSRIAAARYFGEAISRRLRARNWELSRPPARAGADVRLASTAAPRARGGPGAWIEGYGVFGEVEGRGNASDMTARAYGLSTGLDYRLPERLPWARSERYRVGIGLGYARHAIRNDTGFVHGDGNGVQTAVYAGYRGPHFHAGAAGRFGWTSMETERRLLFTSVDRRALGQFEGLEWGALVEAGGHFGDRRRVLVHPLARFEYLRTEQDGFAETGAGDLSLAVPRLAFDSLLLTLGARVSRVFTLEGEFGIEPELRAAWTIDYGDRGRHVPATFFAVPGATPFVTAGTEPDRNAVTLGLGYVMMVGEVPLLSTHYDFQFGENHTRHVISAGLFFRW